jgi:hypothetical protein
MNPRRSLLVLLVAPLLAASAACSTGTRDGARLESADKHDSIADLHQRKCGNCHRLVEPSSRARADIQSALGRHAKRLRLTHAEWTALTDYLAPEAGSQAKR